MDPIEEIEKVET
jgi:hypothetical protein